MITRLESAPSTTSPPRAAPSTASIHDPEA
jgi:hypothetical protein